MLTSTIQVMKYIVNIHISAHVMLLLLRIFTNLI